MIISKLMGGHSNQLFQYALGRKLADKHGTTLLLDTTWFDTATVDSPRIYELGDYPIRAKTTNLRGIHLHDHHGPIPFKNQLKRSLGLDKAVWTIYEEGQGFHPEILKSPDNVELIGYWQCEQYFADIRDELLKDLELKTKLTAQNRQYLQSIKNCEAVAVHIRRGDYVDNDDTKAFHGVPPLDYYQKAVDYIAKQTSSKVLAVFVISNDIAWCKQNIRFDLPTTFIEGNTAGAEDMRLMKHAKHFVMSNSSFSWWGAWLSQNPSKIVAAPKRWFQDESANNAIDIVPDNWVRL